MVKCNYGILVPMEVVKIFIGNPKIEHTFFIADSLWLVGKISKRKKIYRLRLRYVSMN
jgi:hypothetical protein